MREILSDEVSKAVRVDNGTFAMTDPEVFATIELHAHPAESECCRPEHMHTRWWVVNRGPV